jgi:8-oxo-dGTP pyrophosphatase MutT (NUDIX family)
MDLACHLRVRDAAFHTLFPRRSNDAVLVFFSDDAEHCRAFLKPRQSRAPRHGRARPFPSQTKAPMKPSSWEKRSERIAFQNPWWTYKVDRFAMPNGREGEYHYVHTAGSVMILPVTDDGGYLLVEQHRYLNRRNSLEFPGGSVPEGMDPLDAAQKELSEETGFRAAELAVVGRFNPYNGVTDEICTVFLARDLSPADAAPDETEDLRVHRMNAEAIDDLIAGGELWDGMTLAAWMLHKTNVRPNGQASRMSKDDG